MEDLELAKFVADILKSDPSMIEQMGIIRCVIEHQHQIARITLYIMFLMFSVGIFRPMFHLIFTQSDKWTGSERAWQSASCLFFSTLFFTYEMK